MPSDLLLSPLVLFFLALGFFLGLLGGFYGLILPLHSQAGQFIGIASSLADSFAHKPGAAEHLAHQCRQASFLAHRNLPARNVKSLAGIVITVPCVSSIVDGPNVNTSGPQFLHGRIPLRGAGER